MPIHHIYITAASFSKQLIEKVQIQILGDNCGSAYDLRVELTRKQFVVLMTCDDFSYHDVIVQQCSGSSLPLMPNDDSFLKHEINNIPGDDLGHTLPLEPLNRQSSITSFQTFCETAPGYNINLQKILYQLPTLIQR